MGAAMTYLDEPETYKDVCDGGVIEKDGARYGVCGMQGWRRNMEDAHLSVADFDQDVGLYGVFDGHGGKAVSRFAARELPGLLKANEAYKRRDYKKALEEAFVEVDVRLRTPEGREAVKELDRPEPGKAPKPIVLPKAVVNRFMGRGAATSDAQNDGELDDDAEADKACAPSKPDQKPNESPTSPTSEPSTEVSAAEIVDAAEHMSKNDEKRDEKASGDAAVGEGNEEEDDIQIQLMSEDGEDGEEEVALDCPEDCEDDFDDDMVAISPQAFSGDATPEAQGCTAVVVLVVRSQDGGGPRLYCANAGDSRAVLSRCGAVVALSEDHKPECPQETARITNAGGHVQLDAPGGPRVQGDLNLSRAFGDLRYKTSKDLPPEAQILTAFPEVRVVSLTDNDEFMVIGCDGIWEMLSNQEAIDFVRPKLKDILNGDGKADTPLSSICADLCDRGLCPSMDQAENPAFDGHGCDNMTVTIVALKPSITGEADVEIAKAALEAERQAAIAAGRIAADADAEAPPAKKQKCESSNEGGNDSSAP